MTWIALPSRKGDRPLVVGPSPHEQVTQTAPSEMQECLFSRAAALPGVEVRPSFVSVPGARGIHLSPVLAHGPLEAFLAGTEFAHFHPSYDGSLHLTLPAEVTVAAVQAGWGEKHPAMNAFLLFGPRDPDEVDVTWSLLRVSYHYAVGDQDSADSAGAANG